MKFGLRPLMAIVAPIYVATTVFGAEHPVAYKVEAPASVQAGQSIELAVTFDIEEGWYIYAPTGANAAQGMIETEIAFTPLAGMTAEKVQLPAYIDNGSFHIYEGRDITMRQTLLPKGALAPGDYRIKGKVRYQACNIELCLPPRTERIRVDITVE